MVRAMFRVSVSAVVAIWLLAYGVVASSATDSGTCAGSPCTSSPCQHNGECTSLQYGPACEGAPNELVQSYEETNGDYEAADRFGLVVALSGSGTILAVGGPSGGPTSTIATYISVYHKTNPASTQFDARVLVYPGTEWDSTAKPGDDIALSHDGTYIVFSAKSQAEGRAWVFHSSNNGVTWVQRGNMLNSGAVSGFATITQMGVSVAISDDAACVVLGCPLATRANTFNEGVACVWIWNTVDDYALLQCISEPSYTGNANLGNSVAMNRNATILVVGAPALFNYDGAIFVYNRTAGCSTCQFQTPGQIVTTAGYLALGAAGAFGISVAAAVDVNVFAVGASLASDGTGAVFIIAYSVATRNWTITESIEGLTFSAFGASVAISAAGTVLLVGAPEYSSSKGTTCSYHKDRYSGVYTLQLCNPDGDVGKEAGTDVALKGDGKIGVSGVPVRWGFDVLDFTDNAGYTCACSSGWSGPSCQTDIDECASSPCLRGGTCIDAVNSFRCVCIPEWQGPTCMFSLHLCFSFVYIYAVCACV